MKKIAVLITILLLISGWAIADTTDKDWTFDIQGDSKGWTLNSGFSPSGTEAGYWWCEASTSGSYLLGPENLGLTAQSNHYISIKMRLRNTASSTNYYGNQYVTLRWITDSDTAWDETKSVHFTAWGNNAWHVFNVFLGNNSTWTGTIRQIRFDPLYYVTGKRVEVAWVRVIRDTTPPEFTIKNTWGYEDNEQTTDSNPTIVLRSCFDNASGLNRAEFYKRVHGTENWIMEAIDADTSNGFCYTYLPVSAGSYDFAVRVFDNAGNAYVCGQEAEHWVDNLTVNPSAGTIIKVDPSRVLSPFNKLLTGMNIDGWQWSNFYDPATNSIPAPVEARAKEIRLAVLRFPFGCHADTYYWKRTIGPLASRSDQYINDCGGNHLYNVGKPVFGIDECLRWCEKMGIKQQFLVRFRWPGCTPCPVYDDPIDPYTQALQDAADWVEYCNSPNNGSNPNGGTDWAAVRAANGHPTPYYVKYWEIANEPWANDPYGSQGDPELYSIYFLEYLKAMKAVDPAIMCSSGTVMQPGTTLSTWDDVVYRMAGPCADGFHPHPTVPKSGETNLDQLYLEFMATSKHLDDNLDMRRNLMREWSGDRSSQAKVWVTEGTLRATATPENCLYGLGIAMVDYLRIMAENYDILNLAEFTLFYPGAEGTMVADATGAVRMNYYPFYMLANRCFDNLVKSRVLSSPRFNYVKGTKNKLPSQNDLPLITAFATKSADGRLASLAVINKDKSSSRRVTVDFTSYVPAGGRVDVDIWELNASDVSSTVPIVTTRSATYSSSFTYDFPAHSVTSFIVRPTPVDKASVSDTKTEADGIRVRLTSKTVTAVFTENTFYIEETDRTSGIRIICDSQTNLQIGDTITITGTLSRGANGERCILADSVTKM